MHKGCENVDRRWIQSCYFSRAFSGSLTLTAGGILFLSKLSKVGSTTQPIPSHFLQTVPQHWSCRTAKQAPLISSHTTLPNALCHGLDTSSHPLHLSTIHLSRSSSSPVCCTQPPLKDWGWTIEAPLSELPWPSLYARGGTCHTLSHRGKFFFLESSMIQQENSQI